MIVQEEMDLYWDDAQAEAQDRVQWQCVIAALCLNLKEKDK